MFEHPIEGFLKRFDLLALPAIVAKSRLSIQAKPGSDGARPLLLPSPLPKDRIFESPALAGKGFIIVTTIRA